MNILAINGSPKGKRSNTWRLTSAFLDGIIAWEENGRKQAPAIETLNVNALDIKPCLGCFSCWSKTPGMCCIHDDMQAVIEKIDHTGGGHGLAGAAHLRGVGRLAGRGNVALPGKLDLLLKDSVEHGVGDLVAHLVGMTLGDGLGREQIRRMRVGH